MIEFIMPKPPRYLLMLLKYNIIRFIKYQIYMTDTQIKLRERSKQSIRSSNLDSNSEYCL